MRCKFMLIQVVVWSSVSTLHVLGDVRLEGEVVDALDGQPLAARVYVRTVEGSWHTVRSASTEGKAVLYEKRRGADSIEVHTSISAHPFAVDLPPGRYEVVVERGKECFPASRTIELVDELVRMRFPMRRWIDMADRGWYSGETHVHRDLDELPVLMLAEDLNVAFPLVHWVTQAFRSPQAGTNRDDASIDSKLIQVDTTHVIHPLNTEYEIFTVNGARHTLGAFFVLNHQRPFDIGVPPVRPVAREAHRQGGLIELDKHAWPWSMVLVPVMDVDLYELTNNHIWRTQFGFRDWGEAPAAYMQVERDAGGMTERGWIEYGFANYYALLNCGFRLRPTAGTASGVHPVPFGYGRVYVHCPSGFNYHAWVRGLNEGRSFVTTGPMLFCTVNESDPGTTFRFENDGPHSFRLAAHVVSASRLNAVEIVVNGDVRRRLSPENAQHTPGGFESTFRETLEVSESSWIAVRAYESQPGGRVRFAHSAPFHVDIAEKPLRPRRVEVEYLIQRVEDQIRRSADVLPEEAVSEYRDALKIYRRIAETAR